MKRVIFWLAAFAIVGLSSFANAAPPLDQVRHGLIGTWQSTDDTRYSRQLSADGSVVEHYEGDPSPPTKGTWSIFYGAAPPPEAKGRQLVADGTYLELKEDGDVLLFGLTELSAQTLQMIYLERGNQLSFTRLK
jgi:hypothetical protein